MIVLWVILGGIVFVGLAIGVAWVVADTLDVNEYNRRNKGVDRLPRLWELDRWR